MAVLGILHPGQMGASVGAAAADAGHEILWASHGRSHQTRTRAEEAGLIAVGTLGDLCNRCGVIVSVCPPGFATDLAAEVAASGFDGIYVDANAVSPATAKNVSTIASAAGATVVDGGIVGPPAWSEGSTRLYLAGDGARQVVDLFAGSRLGVVMLDSPYGSASALKMAYAGWTKGSRALLLSMVAYAASAGVADALFEEWDTSQPGVRTMAEGAAGAIGQKAWRFVAEMDEIAASLGAANLPEGFHLAAADAYRRLSGFKDQVDPVTLSAAVEQLLDPTQPIDVDAGLK